MSMFPRMVLIAAVIILAAAGFIFSINHSLPAPSGTFTDNGTICAVESEMAVTEIMEKVAAENVKMIEFKGDKYRKLVETLVELGAPEAFFGDGDAIYISFPDGEVAGFGVAHRGCMFRTIQIPEELVIRALDKAFGQAL